METVILLFILASLDKNSSLQNSLRNFLGFYKENRELLSMLAQTAQGGTQASGAQNEAQAAPQPAPREAETSKKSRPEKVDSLDILDEYLKRCAV